MVMGVMGKGLMDLGDTVIRVSGHTFQCLGVRGI
jgi:hypothetical protein